MVANVVQRIPAIELLFYSTLVVRLAVAKEGD
jgi:hypothetical protein